MGWTFSIFLEESLYVIKYTNLFKYKNNTDMANLVTFFFAICAKFYWDYSANSM